MAKIIKSSNLSTVTSTDSNFVKRDGFSAYKSNKRSDRATTIINSDSGRRTRLSPTVYEILGKPESVDIWFDETRIIISTAPDGQGEVTIKKGRLIYDTELAEKIVASNPQIAFDLKGSTPCGTLVQSQTTDDGFIEVVVNFD